MKKSFFAILIASVFGILIYACSRENSTTLESTQSTQLAFNELNTQIALLNTEYVNHFMPATRGGFWRRLGIFFGCDAGGAAVGASMGGIGAVVGGIWGSLMSLLFDMQTSTDDNIYLDLSSRLSALTSSDTAQDVGDLHNQIISEIINENGEAVYSISRAELLSLILDKVEVYCGEIPEDVMNQIPSIQLNAEKVTNSFCDPTVENPYVVFEEIMPGHEAEVNILKAYCDNLSHISNDQELVVSYTNSFKDLIEASSIPEPSKELLDASVSVGGNSCLLWGGDSLKVAAIE